LNPATPTIQGDNMPLYETTVRTPNGDEKKRVYADTPQEAKRLFEQLYGGPRNVPYIPHIIPS
jgi:hypothetical protein